MTSNKGILLVFEVGPSVKFVSAIMFIVHHVQDGYTRKKRHWMTIKKPVGKKRYHGAQYRILHMEQ